VNDDVVPRERICPERTARRHDISLSSTNEFLRKDLAESNHL